MLDTLIKETYIDMLMMRFNKPLCKWEIRKCKGKKKQVMKQYTVHSWYLEFEGMLKKILVNEFLK